MKFVGAAAVLVALTVTCYASAFQSLGQLPVCRRGVRRSCRHPATIPQPSCGVRSYLGFTGQSRNFTQGNTECGEFPWQVAIFKGTEHLCGGALIDNTHVLTSARCITGAHPSELVIRLGDWDINTQTESYQHLDVLAQYVAVHPESHAVNFQNDIAIIRLSQDVDFRSNPHISPVCLPLNEHTYFEGQTCHSTGWGEDSFRGEYQSILKKVDLTINNSSYCQEALRRTPRLGNRFSLSGGMICAGGEQGRDTCKGDKGGPLVCLDRNSIFRLVGLVSWSVDCGQPGIPGVYVDVYYYRDWIHSVTDRFRN